MARDFIHNAVKNALTNDDWRITDDPYTIEYEGVKVYADLAAERTLAAEKEGREIAVEVKSFLSPSFMHDLENAVGQYNIYKSYLKRIAPQRKLYLAISDVVYERFFKQPAVTVIIEEYEVSLLIVIAVSFRMSRHL